MSRYIPLLERFQGCLLGLAVGDALGGRFEGQSPERIAERFPTPDALLTTTIFDRLDYTDDTQMAIGVAETLVENLEILEERLCHYFTINYLPSRGYGFGARAVLDAMEEGRDYRQVAAEHFPGGSFGNGAAMRVAPVGLFFHHDLEAVWEQARLSALPTHVHPLGIEGRNCRQRRSLSAWRTRTSIDRNSSRNCSAAAALRNCARAWPRPLHSGRPRSCLSWATGSPCWTRCPRPSPVSPRLRTLTVR